MNHFENKVAIVTGGASGIGRALCEELGQRGAAMVGVGRSGSDAGKTAEPSVTYKRWAAIGTENHWNSFARQDSSSSGLSARFSVSFIPLKRNRLGKSNFG